MKRLDLAEVILTLKASGVNDVRTFRWLEAPDARALERAETLLADLGAIDDTTGAITALGRRMLAFPVHPRYARMLLGRSRLWLRAAGRFDRRADSRTGFARAPARNTCRRWPRRAIRRRDGVGFFCADARLALRRAKRLPDGPLPPDGYKRPSRAPGRAAVRAVLAHRGGRRFGHQRKADGSRCRAALSVGWLSRPSCANVWTPALNDASWFMAGAACWRARAW